MQPLSSVDLRFQTGSYSLTTLSFTHSPRVITWTKHKSFSSLLIYWLKPTARIFLFFCSKKDTGSNEIWETTIFLTFQMCYGIIMKYCVFKKVTEDKNLHKGEEIINILEYTDKEELIINFWLKFLECAKLRALRALVPYVPSCLTLAPCVLSRLRVFTCLECPRALRALRTLHTLVPYVH